MNVKLKYDNNDVKAEEKNYRNGNIESDLIPKYSRNISGFEDRIISLMLRV